MGSLEKLIILMLDGEKKELKCPFNPTTITYDKGMEVTITPQPNSDVPKIETKGGSPGKLTFNLLLDGTLPDAKSVKESVESLGKLLKIGTYPDTAADGSSADVNRPPYCKVSWGKYIFFEKALLSSLKVSYTLFLPDGTPIRAKADVSFEQISKETPGQNPTSRSEARKTWLVVEGETLDWIAYKEFGDPAKWRHIAETNNLKNPRTLRPGQLLKIVPLP
ncbi:MAG: LysM peptidoglycan-binding domain-containing protein [Ardenticatenales bacterium]|nr:LysM peptidoglycan-binding domain-containing protein [Ardenticatenales bacterium]